MDEDGFFHFPSADGITIIAAGSTIITSSFPGRVFSGRRNRMEREDKKTLIIPTKRTTILCGENPTALVGSVWYLVSCVWRKCDCYHLCGGESSAVRILTDRRERSYIAVNLRTTRLPTTAAVIKRGLSEHQRQIRFHSQPRRCSLGKPSFSSMYTVPVPVPGTVPAKLSFAGRVLFSVGNCVQQILLGQIYLIQQREMVLQYFTREI